MDPTMGGTDPAGDARCFAQGLFRALPTRYDRLAEWLSFWQNGRWRRAMVAKALGGRPVPALVCDVATGTAGVAIQLASLSNARVVGVDLTASMLRRGAQNVERAGVARHVALAQGSSIF